MEYIFDLCCGEGEEKFKSGGFVSADAIEEEDEEEASKLQKHSSSREKAAVALQLKHGKSIFSSPINLSSSFEPKGYPKSESDQMFLRQTMENHLLFQELSSKELQILIDATEKLQIDEGNKVVRQNENGEFLYIIQRGKLDLFCEIGMHKCGNVSAGDVFGELALLYGQNCPLSVIADNASILWRVDQQTFRHVLARHAYDQDADIQTCLKQVDLFSNLSETSLQKFADALTRVHFEEGDRIVTKGETGEIFYILEKGSVQVHDIGIGDSQAMDQILKSGQCFGERALLTGEPRAANVTALTDVTTLAMDRVTFEKSLGELHEMMDFRAKLNSLKSLPILANSNLTDIELERLVEHTEEICYKKGTKLAEVGKPYPLNVWFIRSGQLLVYGGKSGKIYNLQTGDYFGEKSILGEVHHISSHEATCEENLTTWVLSRESIESVIVDLSRLGESGSYVKSKQLQKSIASLKDLKKHRILGRGGFGKVWLVESKTNGKPFALKVIHKRKLLDSKQERSVVREKELLNLLRHPFILYMVSSFQDSTNLYLVLPLIQGGELFNVVANKAKGGRGLENNDAAFYAGGVIEALGHFHHRYIAYRDLKLENVMIDADGYVKIVDLGFAKVVVEKSFTFCGTPDYLAPEIIMSKGHNHAVDYWSFGVMLFELLVGRSPFNKPNSTHMGMFKRIVLMQYEAPKHMHAQAQDLVQKLLVRKVSERLGMMSRGHYDVRDHPWFAESGCKYKQLLKKELPAPWLPNVKDPLDSSNFDDFSSVEREPEYGVPLLQEEQAIFGGF